jgi:hypothetical protein
LKGASQNQKKNGEGFLQKNRVMGLAEAKGKRCDDECEKKLKGAKH